jgi:uncharacterized protein YbjT (DUF2867 family)
MVLSSWDMQAVPLVRSPNSLARLARFALPVRTVDFLNEKTLTESLQGCEMLVHAALGDELQIVRLAECIGRACGRAQVRRVVLISSAAVFGLVAPEGAGDLMEPQPPPNEGYGRAKLKAEHILQQAATRYGFELVTLRPSLVYGPRSPRMERIYRQISSGVAGVVDQGRGVFNGIYIDNLIEAVRLSLTCSNPGRWNF